MQRNSPSQGLWSRRTSVLMCVLVVMLVGAIYVPTLKHEYVWDDLALFVNSPMLRDVHDVGSFWRGISRPILPETTYFRPAVLSTFVLEFWGNRADPALSHLVNLSLFLLNVVLVGVLASGLQEDGRARWGGGAVAAMLFYGLHPAHTEVVAWVSGRFDLLVSTCGLLLLVADQRLDGRVRSAAMTCAYFVACASKEMAVVFPLAYVSLYAARRADFSISILREVRFLSGLLSMLVAGVIYLGIRLLAMPSLLHADQHAVVSLGLIGRCVYVFRAVWFYIEALFWPFYQLSPQHPLAAEGFAFDDYVKAFGALVVVLSLVVAFRFSRGSRFVLGMLILYFVSLAPVVHIIPLTIGGNIGHERFMAWPLVFVALAISRFFDGGLFLFRPTKKALALVFILWLGLAGAVCVKTVPKWRNEVSLWGWAYEMHPRSGYVQASLVSALFKRGYYDEAEVLGEEILSRDSGRVPLDILITLAQIDVVKGRAEAALEKMLRVDQYLESPVWVRNFLATGGSEKRRIAIRRHLDGLLSGAYLARGDVNNALRYARRGVEGLPKSPNAYLNLARAEYAADNWRAAERYFNEALEGVSEVDRKGPLAARAAFLDERCARLDFRMPQVCEKWRMQPPQLKVDR